MSSSAVRKCPECGGFMEEGKRLVGYGEVRIAKKGDFFGDKIIPYYCNKCGLIKLYREMKRRNKP